MPALDSGEREPYRLTIQNSVIAIRSKFTRKSVHELLTPCDSVIKTFRQRRSVFNIPSTKTPAYYDTHLLEDAFYWMDLSDHPSVTQAPNGFDISMPHTVWGRTALYWLTRGFCFDVRTMQRSKQATEDYYAGWWQDRSNGIPSSAFVMLGRTPSHYYPQLKRDYTQLKLLGNLDSDRDRIHP